MASTEKEARGNRTFTIIEENRCHAVLKVFGVGGGGGNAINTMIEEGLQGVEFIAANTDAQALSRRLAPLKLQLGARLTPGLGAGASPDIAVRRPSRPRPDREALTGADMVFSRGTGRRTGTGRGRWSPRWRERSGRSRCDRDAAVLLRGKPETAGRRGHEGTAEPRGQRSRHPERKLLLIAGRTAVRRGVPQGGRRPFQADAGSRSWSRSPAISTSRFADVKTSCREGVALMGTDRTPARTGRSPPRRRRSRPLWGRLDPRSPRRPLTSPRGFPSLAVERRGEPGPEEASTRRTSSSGR